MPHYCSSVDSLIKQHGHNWSPRCHYVSLTQCKKNSNNNREDNCPCCLAEKQKRENRYIFGACALCLNHQG